MATWIGHPSPTSFPPGTTVHLYPKPATPWSEVGTPPGSETTSAVVSNEGVLTFTGLTEGSSYVGYVASPDRYLKLHVDVAAASGTVTSVNGKEGAVTLKAEDVEAVGTASPAFTGTPTAPTATPGTNTTQLATTAYADAISALAAKKASNLSDLASASTARTNLGLGTAATLASTAVAQTANNLSDLASASTARTNLGLGTAATLASAAVAQTANNLSDLANAGTARTNLGLGTASTLASSAVAQTADNLSDLASATTARTNLGLGSVATKSLPEVKAATRQILRRTISIPAGQVPGNEVVLDEYVLIESGETRKIVWFEVHTTSGTIKVKVGRGEAGTTEISELNALEATESIKLKTALSISLSDKDRLRITLSSGSTPKGLFIAWGEEVVAP